MCHVWQVAQALVCPCRFVSPSDLSLAMSPTLLPERRDLKRLYCNCP